MKTSYRIIETFHEGSPILVQRALDTGDGFEAYETLAQINGPVSHDSARALRVLVCECQDLADRETWLSRQLKYSDNRERTLREEIEGARAATEALAQANANNLPAGE